MVTGEVEQVELEPSTAEVVADIEAAEVGRTVGLLEVVRRTAGVEQHTEEVEERTAVVAHTVAMVRTVEVVVHSLGMVEPGR